MGDEVFCGCGCGTKLKVKSHWKYSDYPGKVRYAAGHNPRGTVDEVNPKVRSKLYQNPEYLKKRLKDEWKGVDAIAEEFGVTAQTIRKYMREGGITLNGLAGEIARNLDESMIVFMPGAKVQEGPVEIRCQLSRSYRDDGSYYPRVKKVMVQGIGLGYVGGTGWSDRWSIVKGVLRRGTAIDSAQAWRVEGLTVEEIVLDKELVSSLDKEKLYDYFGDVKVRVVN